MKFHSHFKKYNSKSARGDILYNNSAMFLFLQKPESVLPLVMHPVHTPIGIVIAKDLSILKREVIMKKSSLMIGDRKLHGLKKVTIATLGIIVAGFLTAFSQQDTTQAKFKLALDKNDEYLHVMESMDKNVIENAKVLIHNLQTKKALFLQTANFCSDEMGRCLDTSEAYLSRLQKATDIAMDEIQVVYYAGLHQHYVNAIKARDTLKAELAKGSPVNSKVKMNAFTIYGEIMKAEDEQKKMQEKMNIKEPSINEKTK